MTPVETVPGMGEGEEKRRRVNSNAIYLIYCKNICKCHNETPSTIKNYIPPKRN
jgi:hypothetical protein